MKKLLFIGIVALMVQSLGAVTLPSTSYSPYSTSTPSDDGFTVISGGTMVTGTYSNLGAGSYGCVELYSSSKDIRGCQDDCCEPKYFDLYGVKTIYQCYSDPECVANLSSLTECKNECARSLGNEVPLDGGLSILLILSLAGGILKLFGNINKEQSY